MFFDLANHFVPSCFYFRDCNFNSIRILDCQIKIFELGYQNFHVTQHVVNKTPHQHTTYNISKKSHTTQHTTFSNIFVGPTFLLCQHVGKCCTTCCVVSSLWSICHYHTPKIFSIFLVDGCRQVSRKCFKDGIMA